jgi:D-alanyl-D-alanine carboxypeptidase
LTGATTNPTTHAAQFRFMAGDSVPRGPGTNASGLGIFRYQTRCGTVHGHTGGIPGGYTQFAAASSDGTRSATVSVDTTLVPQTNPQLFPQLRQVFELATCAALAGT